MSDGVPTSLTELLDAAIRAHMARVHVSIPAKVVKADLAANTVDVEIAVEAAYFDREGEREYEARPNIPSVPIVWPRAGGKILTLPIAAGDYVLLVFSEQSLAEWRLTGQRSRPQDARRHSIGYPFAIPGASPDVDVLNPLDVAHLLAGQGIFGVAGGKQVRAGSTGIEIAPAGVTPVSPIALATPLLTFVSLIAAASAAGAASDASISAALTAIQAALAALVAIPANAAAAAAVAASGTAVTAAATSATASGTAATAASAGATTAAGAVPSTVARAL